MSPQGYTEDQIVEQPAVKLFELLGWASVNAMEENVGSHGSLGRETKGDVVLVNRLRASLVALNPNVPADALDTAIEELTRPRYTMSEATANREVHDLLRDGVKVSVPDTKHGGQKTERLRIVDWDNPTNNDFLVVSQMTIVGPHYTCRPDLIGFVNGLPLVVIELKKPGIPVKQAFEGNLTSYKHPQNGIPALFWYNALLIVSNGTDSRVGSLTADWERYIEWKRVQREDEPRRVSLDVVLRGTCDPGRLLDIVENFTLFSEHKAGLVKVLAQNHQYLGVNNSIASMLKARAERHGRGGVFWQTQGSGKSYSMVFFSQKVLRKVPGDWTFVVVTDRVELDNQIARTFAACGAVDNALKCHAETGSELRELLRGNPRYVFTLIHKFQTPELLSTRRDIIVLTDEAHRTQYDTLAMNMRSALPNAIFLAFTGTPLIAGEERTREVFGDYVSIYDFQQSVEDGATVPLYYENRTPELRLDNPNLNDDIYELIEGSDLSDTQQDRLSKELGRQYQLITRDDRLDTIARDIVHHLLGRGFQGKAMVVSIDKATALRMYMKVSRYWEEERDRIQKELTALAQPTDSDQMAVLELQQRLQVIRSTDMAVIVSAGQNEIEDMKKLGLDITPHRQRMNAEHLDEKFKDPKDPLSLVFVCAMWLTGFDAPSCSTVYLDKPMRNHTLMQTIARANRVYPGKQAGLIVDYANVFASLEKALAIYGKGRSGEHPVQDKSALVAALRLAVEQAEAFCVVHGADLRRMEAAAGMDRLRLLKGFCDALILPDTVRNEFLERVAQVKALLAACKPDPSLVDILGVCGCLNILAEAIRLEVNGEPPDISSVMADIQHLLDESIAAEGFVIREESGEYRRVDLTKIDFDALSKRFAAGNQKRVELERLRLAVLARLQRAVQLNPTRVDYLQKFEQLIDEYNQGSRNIDDLFEELMTLTEALSEEESRNVREHLTEEELTIFDILTRPGPDLSPAERNEVKKVARALLTRLKSLLVSNWRIKQQSRKRVQVTIEDVLDEGLPRAYSKDLYETKCTAVFGHIFERYYGDGRSIFEPVH